MSVRWFFSGWWRMEAQATLAHDVLELCRRYGLTYCHWHNDEDRGCIRWDMSAYTASFFLRRCIEENLSVTVLARGGMPYLLYRYRCRAGLLLGALLGAALVVTSTTVLWDIRISGNETMTLRQVREELRESGLYVGMPLSGLDPGQMAIQIQLTSKHISWASVNMSGTVAYVEIRERVPTPEREPLQPANLVARCDGVVEEMEIYSGVPMVLTGQPVREGDLLVSGVYDSQAVGWRVTRAAGRILARTQHEFTVEIPLAFSEKQYVGEAILKKTLIFFEKEIKLFKNSGILGTSCDKIININSYTLGEGASLPISLRTECYFPYELRERKRSYEQAQSLAYYELESKISQTVSDGILLRKVITPTLTENACLLHCRIWCLEDIARVSPFSVEELAR